MKDILRKLILIFMLAVSGFGGASAPLCAQQRNVSPKTDSKIIYHNGQVMRNASHVYFLYYGCWTCGFPGSDLDTELVIGDVVSNLGLSPYFRINSSYPDSSGISPSGALVYAGTVRETTYSHGNELTVSDIPGIISDQFNAGLLPQDPAGIYLVIASSDISSLATGFCSAGSAPHHGQTIYQGTPFRYAFIGNAARCPSIAASQFVAPNGSLLPSPNGNYAADAMASTMAQALNVIVTNPNGNGWYDRYGLENASKCKGKFGTTYTTANGARANMRLGARDYLIQQNWVNDGRGYCSLSYP
jgi:hypothetical protein